MRTFHRRGFTLLELSIVLIIIVSIVGGIMGGRVLLRQSQVARLYTDEQMYMGAVQAFSDKYAYFPGDMPTATNYWGSVGGNSGDNYTASCYTMAGTTGTSTCNGNGDGKISATFGGYESFRAWQHLADAGLIGGNYRQSGTNGQIWTNTPGTDNPQGNLDYAQFVIGWRGNMASAASGIFPDNYRHSIEIYGRAGTGLLTPGETQSLDLKFDDGQPGIGKIRAGYSNSCTSSSVAATATYNLATTTPGCFLYFPQDF